ncbi:MAG: PKD domain-containing protein, partial [Clostridia bacterium]|nr:PKD domain-containing protein [Clostridia bacterium]
STTALQFIAANTIKSFSVAELTENGQESSEYFIPVVAGEMSQSVDFTVPAGYKYMFQRMRTINQNGFNSECEAYIKLQKLVDGNYVTVDDCWYNIPYKDGLWYTDGPFITAGSWRLTFAAVPGAQTGKKAIVSLYYRCETNTDDYTYPRLGGLRVTPKIYGMEIDVSAITIPEKTVEELFTYITVNKGKTIADITGSATATASDAKAVIRAFLEDKNNYDYVRVWRRARNSTGFNTIRDIRASDNWQYTDLSDNLEANTEYVYMAEVYYISTWDTWYYGAFDRHNNHGWFRTELSDPLYVLPEDNVAPVISDLYFRQPGDLIVEKISNVCTIFTRSTDNQRVKSYKLEYKLSTEDDSQYRNIDQSNSVTTKEFTYNKSLRYVTLVTGSEYTFRFTVTDANGNVDVKTFTAVAEDIPAPQDFTVTKDSSSVVITWTPKAGYRFSYDFYDKDGNRFISGAWFNYESTSSENGCIRYYVDPIKYPTFTIKQYQQGIYDYNCELDYIYKYEQSVGADDEAPIIIEIRPYESSRGGYANRFTNVRAKDDGRLYSIEIGYYTRSGEEGSYVYTPAAGFPALAKYYYPTADVPFNGNMWFRSHYDCRNAEPGKYYVGVRVTDTANNASEWMYREFTVSASDVSRMPMPAPVVTAGSDRFYIEPYTPYFDSYARQKICESFIPYWNSIDLTEEMINDFLDHILDYAKIEYWCIRTNGDSDENITNRIVNGEFAFTFEYGDRMPLSGNLSGYVVPERYYCFYIRLVEDTSKEMEAWQRDIFDGSDIVWITSAPTAAIKLLDDTGAPQISDVINTSGEVNVDNSSVISVNVTDDQLIKEVVIEYRVNGGNWFKADSNQYSDNGGFEIVNYATDKISSVSASIKISRTRYNTSDRGDYNGDGRNISLKNEDIIEIVAYAIDHKGNKSVIRTVTYTYLKIEPPTGLTAAVGNASATVSWDKVELPEGVLDGTPEYGYRVYAYKSNGTEFSATDVLPGVTSAVIPLDVSKYTGAYYFKVCVLTHTGGLGDMTDKSANVTPLADITPPTGKFDVNNTTALAGTNTNGEIRFKVDALDNNYVKTLTVNVTDESGNVYATWIYETVNGYYWGYNYNYSNNIIGAVCGESGRINTLDLGDLAGAAALTDANGKRYIPDGIYKLTLTVTDFANLTCYYETAITVDNLAPDITGGTLTAALAINGPNSQYGYERLVANVSWSIPEGGEALSGIEVRRYEFSELKNAQNLIGDPATYASEYWYNTVSTAPDAVSIENGLSAGKYYVYVLSAIDIAGNRSEFLCSDILFSGAPKYDISVKVNGSAEFTNIMLGDKLTFTVTSTIAKQGVILRLYRVVNNRTYWFAEGVFDANGVANVEYTVPAADSGWIGAQSFYAEYYYNSNFGSNVKELDVGLKLFKPEYVNVSSQIGKISVSWGYVSNSEKYRLYRSTTPDGIVNAGNLVVETTARSYNDILAGVGTEYYYAVVAVANAFGQEITSEAAVTATAVAMIRDDYAPSISSVTPNEKAHIENIQTFAVKAYDNVKVSSIIVEWKSFDDVNAIFAELYNGEFNGNDVTVDFSKVHAGASQNIFVRFRVLDPTGNKSEWKTNVYAFGDTLAAPVSLIAEPGERKIALGWQSVLRLDVTGYRIYRAEGTGAYEFLAEISSAEGVYVDDELNPTVTYKYKVCAVADGVEGAFSNTVTALPGEQKTPPTVIYLDPLRSSSFNGDLTLTAVASDRIAIKRFTFEYAYIGISSAVEPNEDLTWQPAAVVTEGIERTEVDDTMLAGLGHSAFKAVTVIDFSALAGLEEGAWFAVRVNAENNGGATYASSWYYAKYKYDSMPPEAPSDLKAADAMSGGCITLSFTEPSTDVYYTRILRSTDPAVDPNTLQSVGETASGSFSDTGLTDGVRYYYWFVAVDRAGNASAPVGAVSAVPTSAFSIEFKSVMTDVAIPAAGKPMKITVNFTNNGPAKAAGTLVLKASFGSETETAGTKDFSGLAPGNHSYTFDYTVPENWSSVTFTAEACSKDIVTSAYAINHAPTAVITAKSSVESSNTETYGAEASSDPDAGETENLTFVWDMGDGTVKNGKSVTYRYLLPGNYTITLTATDQRGASSSVTKSITVIDRRPDLIISSIAVYRMGATDSEYTLVGAENPVKENDTVRVDATVSNSASAYGEVPADMSFLVGFYLNGVYRGYQTVSGGLPVGGEKTVSFTYTAETGAQIIKIVANDLLDTLKESNKQNNSKTDSYNAEQTDFAEIALTGGDWLNATTLDKTTTLTSEEKIIYSANVANSGKASAKFNVSLYIDGVLCDTVSVNLAPGAARVVNFYAAPSAGKHTVIIAADDPLLIETDNTDNSVLFETSVFTVNKAEITTELTVEYPTGMTGGRIAQGGTLVLTATLTPNADISKAVNVRFYID